MSPSTATPIDCEEDLSIVDVEEDWAPRPLIAPPGRPVSTFAIGLLIVGLSACSSDKGSDGAQSGAGGGARVEVAAGLFSLVGNGQLSFGEPNRLTFDAQGELSCARLLAHLPASSYRDRVQAYLREQREDSANETSVRLALAVRAEAPRGPALRFRWHLHAGCGLSEMNEDGAARRLLHEWSIRSLGLPEGSRTGARRHQRHHGAPPRNSSAHGTSGGCGLAVSMSCHSVSDSRFQLSVTCSWYENASPA
jgi:hypothetical protein